MRLLGVLAVALVVGTASPVFAQATGQTFVLSCQGGLTFRIILRPDENGNAGKTATLMLGELAPQLLTKDVQAETLTYVNAHYKFQAVQGQKAFQLIELRNGRVMMTYTCK